MEKVRLMPRSFMPLTLLKNLANTHFQEIRPNGLQVRMVCKPEWSTSPSGLHVDHSDRGFWLFTG